MVGPPRARVALGWLLLATLAMKVGAFSRSVEFSLTTDWPTWELSPLQEAVEYLATEHSDDHGNDSLVWELLEGLRLSEEHRGLLDRAAAGAVGFRADEQDAVWATTLQQTSPLLHPFSHSLMQLYVATRAYSPTLQLHRTLMEGPAFEAALTGGSSSGCSNGSTVWAAVSFTPEGDDTVVCDASALTELLARASPDPQTCSAGSSLGECRVAASDHDSERVMSFDHKYPLADGAKAPLPGAPVVILYAPVGTSAFSEFHDVLAPKASNGELTYVLRHFVPSGSSGRTVPTALQGYGVYLDIKNMEYKNIDDSPSGGGAGGAEGGQGVGEGENITFPEDEDVAGLVFSRLLQRRPQLAKELQKLRANLLEESQGTADTNMKVWRMRDLGLQAAQSIVGSKDPLRKLVDVAQNFPNYASKLSSMKVRDDLRLKAMGSTQVVQNLGLFSQAHGIGSVLINGAEWTASSATFNVFDLLRALRQEVHLLQAAQRLAIPPSALADILQLGKAAQTEFAHEGFRIDIYRGAKGAIHYINNIEKDPQYRRMPRSLRQLMFPSWQLHAIGRNLYTMTLIADPAEPESLAAVGEMHMLLERGFPVRFSVIPVSSGDVARVRSDPSLLDGDLKALYPTLGTGLDNQPIRGDVVPRLMMKAKEESVNAMASFLWAVAELRSRATYKQVVDAYAETMAKIKSSWTTSGYATEAWQALRSDEGLDSVRLMLKLVADRGIPVGCYVLNGQLISTLDIEGTVLQLLGREQSHLARMVAEGRISDSTKSILGEVVKGPNTFVRHHPIVDSDYRARLHTISLYGPSGEKLLRALRGGYLRAPGAGEKVKALTAVLLADLSSPQGFHSLHSVLQFLKDSSGQTRSILRVRVIHNANTTTEASARGAVLARLAGSRASVGADDDAVFLEAMIELCAFLRNKPPDCSDWGTFAESSASPLAKALAEEASRDGDAVGDDIAEVARTVLQVKRGQSALMINGRVVPTGDGALSDLDLEVIAQVESRSFTSDLLELVQKPSWQEHASDVETQADLLAAVHTYLNRFTSKKRHDVSEDIKHVQQSESVLILDAQGSSTPPSLTLTNTTMAPHEDVILSNLEVLVVVDPLSNTAQRLSPLLAVMRDHLQLPFKLLLVPTLEVNEFPLKSYYRFAMFSTRQQTSVLFQSLPTQHILTTRIDTPEPWNVQTRYALQDLDNLRCDAKGNACGDYSTTHTSAEFHLKSLLLYGQCFDYGANEAANGLQLVLYKESAAGDVDVAQNKPLSDTLVMHNYGYFQLKADPGVWSVRLAAGRARDLFEIVQITPTGDVVRDARQEAVVVKRDFTHTVHRLFVRKQAGKENIPLLDDISNIDTQGSAASSDEEPGVWSTLSSLWGAVGGGGNGGTTQGKHNATETVHVFSLATGHLYERMLKIMMLSVRKRTTGPVKFWLLENFLSPAFKKSAHVMAEQRGFEVEFVTYKWPDWLRQQTEKQRIIWGYKILFLDVLFPLDVRKIIYVDADQVLRADLRELWELDLKGRPYAYTPFCESRQETLGFQFWRQGYWRNHLQEHPYHISALYVVDLQRFRRMVVGDKLRAIYEQLSRDPNSLSNLDQDLPNYAQHMVPIYSLPQEWLWCETWCSDESKATAKTIDLCNNPQHKESKLDMAKRIISGPLFNESWVDLDEEVKALESRVAQQTVTLEETGRSTAAI